MNNKENYHTLKGYMLMENSRITIAMEDYIEMITRLSENNNIVRIKDLSDCLNVAPPSASKMALNLKEQVLINFEKYGYITLTEKGRQLGTFFIFRHETIHKFLCFINDSKNELEETEKIEHFLSPKTITNIEKFLKKYS